jgi:hypothetical protein
MLSVMSHLGLDSAWSIKAKATRKEGRRKSDEILGRVKWEFRAFVNS